MCAKPRPWTHPFGGWRHPTLYPFHNVVHSFIDLPRGRHLSTTDKSLAPSVSGSIVLVYCSLQNYTGFCQYWPSYMTYLSLGGCSVHNFVDLTGISSTQNLDPFLSLVPPEDFVKHKRLDFRPATNGQVVMFLNHCSHVPYLGAPLQKLPSDIQILRLICPCMWHHFICPCMWHHFNLFMVRVAIWRQHGSEANTKFMLEISDLVT